MLSGHFSQWLCSCTYSICDVIIEVCRYLFSFDSYLKYKNGAKEKTIWVFNSYDVELVN